jgi:LmbE family N-acetylglucosaminyl deacetylase
MTTEGPPRRALVIAAHPDDIEFGAAGTVAAWRAQGIEVAYCLCSSGEAGTIEGTAQADVPGIRRDEQHAAAAEIDIADVSFLNYPDGAIEPTLALRRDLARAIRAFRPDRVVSWSPEINWDHIVTAHPDHRAVGAAALAAVYPDSRNALAHPELVTEGFEPWTVRELWLADGPLWLRTQPVDVTDVFPRRMAALNAHRTQVGGMEGLTESMRESAAHTARRLDLPDGVLAESFQLVRTG